MLWGQSAFRPRDTTGIYDLKTSATQTTRALVSLPSDYLSHPERSYAILLFNHGAGEQANTLAQLCANQNSGGPSYWIAQGLFPDSIYNPVQNKWYQLIIVSPIHTTVTSNPPDQTGNYSSNDPYQLSYMLADLTTRYRVLSNRVYLTGLSAGGEGIVSYMANVDPTTNGALTIPMSTKIAGGWIMSIETGSSQAAQVADSMHSKHIGIGGEGDPNETHGASTQQVIQRMNADSAGCCLFAQNNFGHSRWDYYYKPRPNAGAWDTTWRGYTHVGMYEMMIMDSSGVASGGGANSPPTANAGPDRTVYINRQDTAHLVGSGSAAFPATSVTYLWTKISGPGAQSILSNTTTTPTITGLQVGSYVFQIKVTDNNSLFSTDQVSVIINTGCGGRNVTQTAGTDSGRTLVPSVSATYNPGDTLTIPSNRQWTYWSADGLHGTQACPLTIINDTGQVVMYAGIAVTNSTHVHITGTGNTKYFYGFYITSYPGKPTAQRGNSLQADGRSAWIEIDHIDEYLKTYGLWAKNEQSCQDSTNNWRLHNYHIHHIRGRNINQDWIYALSTAPSGIGRTINCSSLNYSPAPSHGADFEIDHMIGDSIGRTGIQLSGADSGANSIHDCDINGTGYENNPQQGSGIILGGLTTARVYNNHIRNTFQHGISVLGAGICEVDHNDIDSSGMLQFPGVDSVTLNPGYTAISVDTRGTTTAWPNTVSNPPSGPLTPTTRTAIPLTISVHDNKVGVNDQFDNIIHDYYEIRIGAGYNPAQPWTTNNLVYNNFKQDGITPAVFGVNSQITYSTGGSTPVSCNCTYFFSNSGNDAHAGDSLNPFQTLAKLNTLSGDSTAHFRLKRGDSWHEGVVNFGGKSLKAYGVGTRPKIDGFVTLSSFASLGGNIYAASCSGCNINTNIVTIDGVQQIWARTPNTGMYNYTGWSSNNWVQDNSRTNVSHPGGYISIRNYHANQTTNKITLQSGDTIKYTPSKPAYTASTAAIGYGYFFIGDSTSLDVPGEWWYSTVSGNMNIVGNPTGHTVKATGIDTLMSLRDGLNGVVIDGIHFEGAGIIALYIGKDTNTVISNCNFHYTGEIATYVNGAVNTSITNCHYNQTNDIGVYADNIANNAADSNRRLFLRQDTILNTGMLRGQARLIELYDAIFNASTFGVVDRCKIDTVGYIGIMGYNDSAVVNNSVLYSCMLLDDGAAYYHLAYTDSTKVHLVRGNIFAYAVGNIEGTGDGINQGYGAYWDNNGVNAWADSNTFYMNGRAGIFIHNTRKSKFTSNTFHKNNVQILIQGDDNTKPVSGNTIKGNIMSVDTINQRAIALLNGTGVQLTGTVGLIDSNYYAWKGSSTNQFYIYNGHGSAMDFPQWHDSTGETHAFMPGPLGFFQFNPTGFSINLSLNGSFLNVKRIPQFNSVILPAYRSIFFLTGNFLTGMKRGQRIRFK